MDIKKRFTESQIIGFLEEGAAWVPGKELCRKLGFSGASLTPGAENLSNFVVITAQSISTMTCRSGRRHETSGSSSSSLLTHNRMPTLNVTAADSLGDRTL